LVTTDMSNLLIDFLRLVFLTSVVLYAGLVLISYGAEGTRKRPQIELKDPAGSAEKILVWLGVVTLAWGVRRAARTFAMLAEASATVGEWYLSRYAPETLAALHPRSRG